MAKKTADEKFVLKVYEMAMQDGDQTTEVNFKEAGMQIGEIGKKINNIVGLLCNSGFAIKKGDSTIALTPKGIKLAIDLQDI